MLPPAPSPDLSDKSDQSDKSDKYYPKSVIV